jgi:hypothetical protein
MYQLQRFVRPQLPQQFNGAEGDAAAAVGGDTAGFVQGQQRPILVHDAGGKLLHRGLRRRAPVRRGIEPHRRNPDLIAARQARIGLGALAVHPYLAGAQDAVDQGARGALELAQQEIVYALAVAVFLDPDQPHARTRSLPLVCRHDPRLLHCWGEISS